MFRRSFTRKKFQTRFALMPNYKNWAYIVKPLYLQNKTDLRNQRAVLKSMGLNQSDIHIRHEMRYHISDFVDELIMLTDDENFTTYKCFIDDLITSENHIRKSEMSHKSIQKIYQHAKNSPHMEKFRDTDEYLILEILNLYGQIHSKTELKKIVASYRACLSEIPKNNDPLKYLEKNLDKYVVKKIRDQNLLPKILITETYDDAAIGRAHEIIEKFAGSRTDRTEINAYADYLLKVNFNDPTDEKIIDSIKYFILDLGGNNMLSIIPQDKRQNLMNIACIAAVLPRTEIKGWLDNISRVHHAACSNGNSGY